VSRAFTPVVQVRRPTPGAPTRSTRAAVTPARAAGTPAGVPRFAQPAPVALSQRGDRWETEARRVSEAAARAPVASPAQRAATPPVFVSAIRPRPTATVTPARAVAGPTPTASLVPGTHSTTLTPDVRERVETVTGTPLSHVRVHTGPAAHAAAAGYHARAFTVGSHIYLGSTASPTDTRLLSHEAAHAAQQTMTLANAPPHGPPTHTQFYNPHAARGPPGPAAQLTPAPAGMIQREELDPAPAPEEPGLLERGFWAILDELVDPRICSILHEIRRVGFGTYLKNKVSEGLATIFSGLRAQGGFSARLADIFQRLLDQGRVVMAALMGGDCEPLFAAVRAFRDTLSAIAGRAWNSITDFLQPIGDYLSHLWTRFGAPVVDFLGEFAADSWQFIQHLGHDLWEFTRPAREYASSVWTEIKNLLGFGEGADDDGSGGLTGWITQKAGEAWDEIKLALEPVVAPIREVVARVEEILPLDAIVNLRNTVTTWMDNAMQMADNMDKEEDVAENQDLLREIVLPRVRQTIGHVQARLAAASSWVTGLIGGLVDNVSGFYSALSRNRYLSPAAASLRWLSDEVTAIGRWETNTVTVVFDLADHALATLDAWIVPILNALNRLLTALGDLMGHLGDFVLGPFLLIPKCIREPIKNFLIESILGRIPIFSQLIAVPAMWARAQTVFRRIVMQIFRDGDLFGAAWTFFREVLQLFDLPPALVTNLLRNAARSMRDILRDPAGFLINLLLAVKTGFLQFFENFGHHLLNGVANWLFGALGDTGIQVPTEFSLRAVVDLVLQVLDVSQERIFQAIEKRVGPERTAQLRRAAGVAGEALGLIQTLVTEGPAGLWREILSRLDNLWSSIVSGVTEFLMTQVVAFATRWLLSLVDVSGITPVINTLIAIYDAIQSFFRYLRQMLEVVNSVFEGLGEIARGVITRGANLVEASLARIVPIAIGFLADQIGLSGLPNQVRRVVSNIRAGVDRALEWIVDKVVNGITAVVGAVRSGVATVRSAISAAWEWLTTRETFQTDDGEQHAIYLEGEGENAQVMMASTPAGIQASVNRITVPKEQAKAQGEADALGLKLASLKTYSVSAQAAGNKPASTASGANTQQIRTLTTGMRAHMRALAEIFNKTLFPTMKLDDLPATSVHIPSGGKALNISAELTANRKKGTPPTASPPGWAMLVASGLTAGAAWVRLHLVNEGFEGTGTSIGNLVPGTRRNNSNHLATVENPMKELIGGLPRQKGKRGAVWYAATVTYQQPPDASAWPLTVRSITLGNGKQLDQHVGDFAKTIHFTWGVYSLNPAVNPATTTTWADWQQQTSPLGDFILEIPLPPFTAAHAKALATVTP